MMFFWDFYCKIAKVKILVFFLIKADLRSGMIKYFCVMNMGCDAFQYVRVSFGVKWNLKSPQDVPK